MSSPPMTASPSIVWPARSSVTRSAPMIRPSPGQFVRSWRSVTLWVIVSPHAGPPARAAGAADAPRPSAPPSATSPSEIRCVLNGMPASFPGPGGASAPLTLPAAGIRGNWPSRPVTRVAVGPDGASARVLASACTSRPPRGKAVARTTISRALATDQMRASSSSPARYRRLMGASPNPRRLVGRSPSRRIWAVLSRRRDRRISREAAVRRSRQDRYRGHGLFGGARSSAGVAGPWCAMTRPTAPRCGGAARRSLPPASASRGRRARDWRLQDSAHVDPTGSRFP